MGKNALVFGYGQLPNGEIDEETKQRCLVAVRLYSQFKINQIYLTVSAYIENKGTMAYGMRKYLIFNGVLENDIFVYRNGMNTAGEMDVFLSKVPSDSEIIFVSTWYHVPRIIWLALCRIPWNRFSVGVAWRGANWADILIEPLKMANAVLRSKKSAKFYEEKKDE